MEEEFVIKDEVQLRAELEAVTKTFLFLLSRQPDMTMNFSDTDMLEFPFDEFTLITKREAGGGAFMLKQRLSIVM